MKALMCVSGIASRMASNSRDQKIRNDYDFLRESAKQDKEFTLGEWATSCSRQMSSRSQQDYYKKKLKQFVYVVGADRFKARPDILNVSFEEFAPLYRQSERLFTEYDRVRHSKILIFEFFMPLSQERKLRKGLDRLFLANAIRQRLEEIGLTELQSVMKPLQNEYGTPKAYFDRLSRVIGDNFYGYSVSHVAGRFRMTDLKTQQGVYEFAETGAEYLADETTAVVKFIIPCDRGEPVGATGTPIPSTISLDFDGEFGQIHEIRYLFHRVFVDSVIRMVSNEDEIWLLESGASSRLYRWKKKVA
jgi:hypothetical protein